MPHCDSSPNVNQLYFYYMTLHFSQDELRKRVVELEHEHRSLDQLIANHEGNPDFDPLELRRLKKRKLQIKDMLKILHSQLIPDLNA